MPPVIIGGAIAAAGAVGAAAIGSKANSKAIKQATQAQTDSTAQQIAYQREADSYARAALNPWMTRGNLAGDTIMAALGLGGNASGGVTTPAVTSPYTGPNPAALTPPGGFDPALSGAYASNNPNQYRGDIGPMWATGDPVAQPATTTTAAPAQPAQTPQQAAASAYEIFKQSTGYQSRFSEGMRALSSNYFGGGVGQSGAAVKAALRFGQDYASREFGNWLGALGNQQGLGFAGASALAGVSQGNADRLGQISQNSADATGQAAIARAQNQGALWTGVAGAAGQLAGALSSYSKPPTNYGVPALSGPVVNNYGYA